MDSGVDTFFIGEYADFVFVSTASISLMDLSVFYIQENMPASITSTNAQPYYGLSSSSLTFQADSFDPITITFTDSCLRTAADVVSYINTASGGIVTLSGGFQAVEKNGFVVMESLTKGLLSQIQSLAVNTTLGFTVETAFGTDQEKIEITPTDLELTSVMPSVYAVTFLIDSSNFYPGESYFVFANVTPPQIQKFKVVNNTDFVSVNFVS